MQKIKNPFAELAERSEYNCFGCSPKNDIGLQLEFWEDGDEVFTKWQPRKMLEGWTGVVHGGIQATLMDELGGWIVLLKKKTTGVTAALNVVYEKPVYVSRGEITVKGKLISTDNRIAKIHCQLIDGEGHQCASAQIDYFCFPEKLAKHKYKYPGHDAFYEKSTFASKNCGTK